jgi:hypothetical protein
MLEADLTSTPTTLRFFIDGALVPLVITDLPQVFRFAVSFLLFLSSTCTRLYFTTPLNLLQVSLYSRQQQFDVVSITRIRKPSALPCLSTVLSFGSIGLDHPPS